MMGTDRNLIVTIVKKGWGDSALQASIKPGADGGTVMSGRVVGVREQQTILGITIEPEKEVVLSVTRPDKTDAILESIKDAAELCKPGTGLAFVLPVSKVVGVVHEEVPEPSDVVEEKAEEK
jgi:nitrogen regulatory protein PII